MASLREPWRTKVLGTSRVIGWLLAVGVVVGMSVGVAEFLSSIRAGGERGRLEARAFIDKVRVCHRAPPPHPSWAECERLVRSRD